MENDLLLGIFLFIAIATGYFLGRRERPAEQDSLPLSRSQYFEGLNFLLNEEHDKAVEIFINALEVNEDTVETHLALGNIFRKRGEVDRAILIHQNLLNRPELQRMQFEQVQLELAQDYLAAGLYDRAEKILTELVDADSAYRKQAKTYLLHIFELEKDWPSAIATAERLKPDMPEIRTSIAHYCCELAENALAKKEAKVARRNLKRALSYDRSCARANLLLGNLEYSLTNYEAAIKAYRSVRHQNPDYFPEVLDNMAASYDARGETEAFVEYLMKCMNETPMISVVIHLAEQLRLMYGDKEASRVIAEHMKSRPSIRGLQPLIEMHIDQADGRARENLGILQALVEQLMESKPWYQCSHCGFHGKALHWMCPSCQKWGTISPIYGLEGE